MTTDRRLYDMDLGRRDHTRWLGVHRPSGGAPLFPPTTNLLEAWLSDTGVTEAGTGVSSWVGSHASLNMAQATDSKRPTYTLASLGGQPTLDFNGTSDVLRLASGLASAGTAHTTYVVANFTSFAAANYVYFDSSAGRTADRTHAANTIGIFDGINTYSIGAVSTGVQVISWLWNGTTISGYSGSSLVGSNSGLTARAIGGACSIGGNNLETGGYAPVKVAAVLVYDAAHDATARGNVLAFTTAKYGTP